MAPLSYLGVRFVSLRSLLLWCAVVLVFMLCSDLLTLALGKPLVPPYFASLYASAGSPILLLLALAIAAPLLDRSMRRDAQRIQHRRVRGSGADGPLNAIAG